ncbi:MAG: RidA family protein [Lachnospiraceae bacterium]|nr:RidA family protein [Lachnospiraceae bacterium]
MNKTIISTEKSPAAIGPYSQAVEVNGIIYTSGMIPVIPATGQIVEGGVKEQTKQVFENLAALLQAAGSDLSQVFKTTVFIKDMNDFGSVNEVYATFFDGDYPSRSCVEVARLPKDVLIEVEVIALKNE